MADEVAVTAEMARRFIVLAGLTAVQTAVPEAARKRLIWEMVVAARDLKVPSWYQDFENDAPRCSHTGVDDQCLDCSRRTQVWLSLV